MLLAGCTAQKNRGSDLSEAYMGAHNRDASRLIGYSRKGVYDSSDLATYLNLLNEAYLEQGSPEKAKSLMALIDTMAEREISISEKIDRKRPYP